MQALEVDINLWCRELQAGAADIDPYRGFLEIGEQRMADIDKLQILSFQKGSLLAHSAVHATRAFLGRNNSPSHRVSSVEFVANLTACCGIKLFLRIDALKRLGP